MTVKYTENMLEELKAIPRLDYQKAVAFAEKYDISSRSVIAKARSMEIDYIPKSPSASKATPKGPSKDVLVSQIEAILKMRIPSLVKMTMVDLEKLKTTINLTSG